MLGVGAKRMERLERAREHRQTVPRDETVATSERLKMGRWGRALLPGGMGGPAGQQTPSLKYFNKWISPDKSFHAYPKMRTLLNLPTELRLHIYMHVVPNEPLSVPTSQYTGLLYSCRTIRNELESDICKRIASDVNCIVELIHAVGDEIRYTPPTTFYGWRNLTIERPTKPDMFHSNDPFYGFMPFHFDTLTTVFYNGHVLSNIYQHTVENLAREMERACQETGLVPAMKKWVLDWSSDYRYELQLRGVDKSRVCANLVWTWRVHCSWKYPRVHGVEFYKVPTRGTNVGRVSER